MELLGSSSVQTHCLKLSLGGFRVVQSCAETKLRDFGGKLECLFTVILIIRVFSVTSPMKEAKLWYVNLLISTFLSCWLGLWFLNKLPLGSVSLHPAFGWSSSRDSSKEDSVWTSKNVPQLQGDILCLELSEKMGRWVPSEEADQCTWACADLSAVGGRTVGTWSPALQAQLSTVSPWQTHLRVPQRV